MDAAAARDLLQAVLVVVALGALILWAVPGPCRCEKCAYHVNERRMARVRQRELAHDVAHKGFGFRTGDPDVSDCTDDECPRNRRA